MDTRYQQEGVNVPCSVVHTNTLALGQAWPLTRPVYVAQLHAMRLQIENAMKSLKDDPEMGEIFGELESGGPAAMMKYWNDPNVLKKLGDTMGGVFDFQVRCANRA